MTKYCKVMDVGIFWPRRHHAFDRPVATLPCPLLVRLLLDLGSLGAALPSVRAQTGDPTGPGRLAHLRAVPSRPSSARHAPPVWGIALVSNLPTSRREQNDGARPN